MRYSYWTFLLTGLFSEIMEYTEKSPGYSMFCISYQTMPHYLLLGHIHIKNKSLWRFKTFFFQSEAYTTLSVLQLILTMQSLLRKCFIFPAYTKRLSFVYLSWRTKYSLPTFATLGDMITAQILYFKIEQREKKQQLSKDSFKAKLHKLNIFWNVWPHDILTLGTHCFPWALQLLF